MPSVVGPRGAMTIGLQISYVSKRYAKKNLIAAIIWKPVKQVSILENSFLRHRRANKISWSVRLLLTHFKPSRIFTGEAGAYLRVVHSKVLHLSYHQLSN